MKCCRSRICLAIILALGVSQLAQGGWIYIKASLAQSLMQEAWQKRVATGRVLKPWPWADTWPVARLQISRLKVDMLVLAGDSGQALAFGPGLAAQSTGAGEPGIMLISGHRDTHFRFMRDLAVGDRLRIETAEGKRVSYRITALEIVDARAVEIVAGGDRHQLMLATCWPFDSPVPGGPMRYLASAVLIG